MEKLETNRLSEDKSFYDRILGQICDELQNLSRTFDDQNREMGYGRTWEERINKIKAGEKLSLEPELREIIFKISQKSGLSDTELDYLINSLFEPRKYRKQDDD